jgi:aerobic-type carbon monoxide dehydrogenase small subunit (CoxS/CutS family)
MKRIALRVNGGSHEIEAAPETPLVYVLRNSLGLTGTKHGCGLEQCGACAVLVDGVSTLSCMAPVADFEGREIVTIEGLDQDRATRPILEAFVTEGAAQCGYCTPGIVVATAALLRGEERPDEADIRAALHGHLCRCGAHVRILKAVRRLLGAGEADAG